jgi:hypothetical protein
MIEQVLLHLFVLNELKELSVLVRIDLLVKVEIKDESDPCCLRFAEHKLFYFVQRLL